MFICFKKYLLRFAFPIFEIIIRSFSMFRWWFELIRPWSFAPGHFIPFNTSRAKILYKILDSLCGAAFIKSTPLFAQRCKFWFYCRQSVSMLAGNTGRRQLMSSLYQSFIVNGRIFLYISKLLKEWCNFSTNIFFPVKHRQKIKMYIAYRRSIQNAVQIYDFFHNETLYIVRLYIHKN